MSEPDAAEARAALPAIELRGVVKRYGQQFALQGVDLTVPRGEIYGFIGPNGAGKTTTLRILATLTQPTQGFARVEGYDCVREPEAVRRLMGYLPDGAPTARDFTAGEFLEFFAAAYGIEGEQRRRVVSDVLELVDLGGKRDQPLDKLSLGMRQRLGLARVLVHDPAVLLLDEPGTGLDPRARVEIREVLRELQRLGKTILISSHILGELNELCTSVGILEAGQVAFSGSLREALARVPPGALEVRVAGGEVGRARALPVLRDLPQVAEVREQAEDDLLLVELATPDGVADVARALVAAELDLLTLRQRAVDLEDAFLSLTRGEVS